MANDKVPINAKNPVADKVTVTDQADLDHDNALLLKAIAGDIDSFEKLIIKYEKLIFNVAYRMFGNIDDAKDIAQESLIKIYKNIDKCIDIKHFKAWICTITNNTCIDELRRRKGKQTESIDESLELDEGFVNKQLKSYDRSPEDAYLNKELSETLQDAINLLNPEQKTLIILKDIQDLSYHEMSEITNTPLGTVKSRLARARTNLKNIVTKLSEQKKI